MPTIKIIPMPGVAVPGPQGLRGYQGETGLPGPAGPKGAGFEPVTLYQNGPLGFFYNPENTLSEAWGFATRVRVSFWSNRDKYIEGFISQIVHDQGTVVVSIENDFTNGDYSETWLMELTGARGADANTGDVEFSGNTITAHGDLSIGVDVVPGEISLSAYNGVNLQFAQSHQGAGLHFPDGTTQTTAFTGSIFPEPVDWTPVLSNNGFAQSSNISHGHYYKYGRMTVVNLNVPFTNVTNFGTGQYSLTLPFAAATHMDIFGGTLHDTSTNSFYTIKGHVEANSNVMTLWYLSIVTKDAEFDHNSPFELDTTDLLHMNFIYETVA